MNVEGKEIKMTQILKLLAKTDKKLILSALEEGCRVSAQRVFLFETPYGIDYTFKYNGLGDFEPFTSLKVVDLHRKTVS